LAKRTGATVLGPAGLIATMIDLGWVASDKAVRFGKGGRVNPAGPQITITQVRAEHSSEVTVTDPGDEEDHDLPWRRALRFHRRDGERCQDLPHG
jgi:hypothetical protein